MPEQPGPEHSSAVSTHNEVSAGASQVVQARDIEGGVHVHSSPVPAPPRPQMLPPDVAHFTGRDTELDKLDALLNADGSPQSTAVVISAIASSAGIGKTALALRWAHRMRKQFPDGQLYVNLRGYDPGPPLASQQVLHGFLRALGMPGEQIPHDVTRWPGSIGQCWPTVGCWWSWTTLPHLSRSAHCCPTPLAAGF